MARFGVVFVVAVMLLAAPAAAAAPSPVHPVHTTRANQAVVVDRTTMTAYSWDGARWVQALGPYPAHVGARGFTADPHEADGFTPVGEYGFTFAFGARPNPGTAMPYVQAQPQDQWVTDPASPLYNTARRGHGGWRAAEDLTSYPYALAFDFNQNPVVANGNSAIFLHEGDVSTPGCIVVDHEALLALLRWLSPAAAPVIVLGANAAPPPHVAGPITTLPASGERMQFAPATAEGGTTDSSPPPLLWVALAAVLVFAIVPTRRSRSAVR